MHHICVQIKNESDSSNDSNDDFSEFFYDDIGDSEVFMQMWRKPPTEAENPDEEASISSIQRAYQHIKAAIADVSAITSVLQSASSPARSGFAVQKVEASKPQTLESLDQNYSDRIAQLSGCSDFLLSSAASLKSEVSKSQGYFRSLASLSQKIPLKVIQTDKDQRQIAVALSHPTSTNIVIREGDGSLQWSLSEESRFSFNGKSFSVGGSPYMQCFFELMCHELFERIKNDKNRSAIHYSADKTTRSVYFDVGNRETWVFELGDVKPKGDVPVWIPRLLGLIMEPHTQPATFMRQLRFFKATLDSMTNAFCGRFMELDFCNVIRKTAMCKAALQIDSSYLYSPYIAFVDKLRVSMTETPNELRCIPYSTDGRGLTPALEKWCDTSFTTLFLSMAERVTRSFGYVFKNKNQYGTAAVDGKKIKFEPNAKANDVAITISARSSVKARWKCIPGTNHIVRMCVILFQELSEESFK